MEPAEKLARGFGFIGLQVADQMPRAVEVRERRALCLGFLDAVLAEIAETGFVRFANALRREGLRYGDELHAFGPPPHSRRRPRHALSNALDIFANFHWTAQTPALLGAGRIVPSQAELAAPPSASFGYPPTPYPDTLPPHGLTSTLARIRVNDHLSKAGTRD